MHDDDLSMGYLFVKMFPHAGRLAGLKFGACHRNFLLIICGYRCKQGWMEILGPQRFTLGTPEGKLRGQLASLPEGVGSGGPRAGEEG
jgi:hypothetical protein